MRWFKLLVCLLLLVVKIGNAKEIMLSIYYGSGKFEVSKTDSIKIDSIAKIIFKAEKYSILINAYCDTDGSIKDNLILAEKRCKSVTTLFAKGKIINDSIKCNTIGEISNDNKKLTEEDKIKNRRTDVVINYIPRQVKTGNETFSFSEKDLVVGKKLVLPSINFVNGTAEFLVTSYPSLLELLKVMKKYPSLEIEIGGHVCCSNNFPISEERARNVYYYLKKNGISEKRMKYKGYGKTQPIFEDDKEEEKAKFNRRVEVTILKY